jgi:hypothetical protein
VCLRLDGGADPEAPHTLGRASLVVAIYVLMSSSTVWSAPGGWLPIFRLVLATNTSCNPHLFESLAQTSLEAGGK